MFAGRRGAGRPRVNDWPLYSPFHIDYKAPIPYSSIPDLPRTILRDCPTCNATPTWEQSRLRLRLRSIVLAAPGLLATPLRSGLLTTIRHLTAPRTASIHLWLERWPRRHGTDVMRSKPRAPLPDAFCWRFAAGMSTGPGDEMFRFRRDISQVRGRSLADQCGHSAEAGATAGKPLRLLLLCVFACVAPRRAEVTEAAIVAGETGSGARQALAFDPPAAVAPA